MLIRDRHTGKLTNQQVSNIREMEYDDTILERVCEEYNINATVARNILTGKTYKHVNPSGRPLPRQKSKRKLTDEQVEEIKRAVATPTWGQQVYLADKYGVSRNLIQRIQYGTY